MPNDKTPSRRAGRGVVTPPVRPIQIGPFRLTEAGLQIVGRPSFGEYEGVGEFIKRTYKAASWWMADWLRYGEERTDWADRLDQAVHLAGVTEKTLKNVRTVAAIPMERRRPNVAFALHAEVIGLQPDRQDHLLDKAETEGWDRREMRLHVIAEKRRKVIEGQAVLEGLYRVVYADPPWIYGNRPPSGSGAQEHYRGMTIDALCKLPVAAHSSVNAVLFMWVTAPMLYENPGPREVMEAWGFKPKTGIVWDKVRHNFGSYVSVRHEHLLIATRGSCTPDHPTPMPDSVVTERPEGEHSTKPASFRRLIEQMYDGPRLELFGRARAEGWTVFGDDARLWANHVGEEAPAALPMEAGV